MNSMEMKLVRLVAAVGAGLWLARLVFSTKARREVDAAMQEIDATSFKGVDGPEYQQRIRDEWEQHR
ncbi:hypothetical protein [Paraburkholderia sp. BL10I2N1]|uniref:hypothetical protein n=1 Tax=Paraburkholderia sp. BL10I2N1 TaxID=1938796 RepID=UPI00105D79BA|nr:hypothetical protein [Paraburkholderia sp. BL10I2N1]TDN68249.1 hypothetical protein B0G77_1567 [Paraburkholderia sp. BL10I2N1]